MFLVLSTLHYACHHGTARCTSIAAFSQRPIVSDSRSGQSAISVGPLTGELHVRRDTADHGLLTDDGELGANIGENNTSHERNNANTVASLSSSATPPLPIVPLPVPPTNNISHPVWFQSSVSRTSGRRSWRRLWPADRPPCWPVAAPLHGDLSLP